MTNATRTAENSELKRQAEAAAARRANGGKPVAMYRHPDGRTWTGRGHQPEWMAKAISEGKAPADFLI